MKAMVKKSTFPSEWMPIVDWEELHLYDLYDIEATTNLTGHKVYMILSKDGSKLCTIDSMIGKMCFKLLENKDYAKGI